MKPVQLRYDEENDLYTDGRIIVQDFEIWMNKMDAEDQEGNMVEVPSNFTSHATVQNIGLFLSRLTLIVVAFDEEGYNLGSVTGSVLCLEEDEYWEFFGKSEDLGYYDPYDESTGEPCFSRIRGEDVYTLDYDVRVYAIEEDEFGSAEDIAGGLGQKG